jgi:hypothetical protein
VAVTGISPILAVPASAARYSVRTVGVAGAGAGAVTSGWRF